MRILGMAEPSQTAEALSYSEPINCLVALMAQKLSSFFPCDFPSCTPSASRICKPSGVLYERATSAYQIPRSSPASVTLSDNYDD